MNLYRLELRKIRLSVYLRAAAGICAALLSMGLMFLFIFQSEGVTGPGAVTEPYGSWNGLLALTAALAFSCFSVLSAVLAARLIVGEYCGKYAVLLLCYPVKRIEMLAAKCMTVCVFTAACTCAGIVSAMGFLYAAAQILGIKPQLLEGNYPVTVLACSLLAGIMSSQAGLVSAAFGCRKRSKMAAIVCSLILVCCCANVIVISPEHIVWVMAAMAFLFTVTAGFSCRFLAARIETMEV